MHNIICELTLHPVWLFFKIHSCAIVCVKFCESHLIQIIWGPRWGFAGCGIRPFLVAGFGIGSKIVAGYGIQISAGCGIGHKIIAGFGIQISRGNGMRSENFSGHARWSIFTLKGNRNSRIDSKNIKILLHLT